MDRISNYNLIGISGKMGHGKDAVGQIIRGLAYWDIMKGEHKMHKSAEEMCLKLVQGTAGLGTAGDIYSYQIKKMADTLKEMVCLMIGCTREQLEDRDFKASKLGPEWGEMTVREMLQKIGTEMGRNVHPNTWCNSLFSKYKALNPEEGASMGNVKDYSNCKFPKWIVTDIRFPNEAQAIKDRGGCLIRVHRPKQPDTGNHPSEIGLDDWKAWDFYIGNGLGIEELIEAVKILM